jgi:hypothetical protein
MAEPVDVFRLLGYIEDDLRGLHAKLTEVRAMLAAMNLPAPKPTSCPEPGCGVELRPPTSLADHLRNVHGKGPS